MLTAKALTELVAQAKPDRAAYCGVSDHMPHVQQISYKRQTFVLGTFNVLNPAFMYYQNGVPPPGESLPKQFRLEDQRGLEHLPSSQPERQTEREAIILNAILDFMKKTERTVLCLQECWSGLTNGLLLQKESIGFEVIVGCPIYEKSYNVTLVSKQLEYTVVNNTKKSITIELGSMAISNVHLEFSSIATLALLKKLLQEPAGAEHHWVVGDFNVQTQPLSPALIYEQVNTATLCDVAQNIMYETKREPWFAVHPRRWTNWNNRANCSRHEQNAEHFDNLMLVSSEPAAFVLQYVDWMVEMKK